ncbi:LOW QUALITY PROTEIN: transmembrane protease serine 9-like [Anopheles moucheti]|uniref:LOW QUALITY PROTEIN: transmembrane protease serine 9-like n=1 Tax=Anopheles moucheti TaxID=186751 RepID=UPI0022F1394E|nr:LOW QUALITY PROTEIN: transmembrane protease serine 9-like [Anopheles moucheti]
MVHTEWLQRNRTLKQTNNMHAFSYCTPLCWKLVLVSLCWLVSAEENGGCPACVCGKPSNSPLPNTVRVIGGQTSDIDRFPWMAALYYRERFTCGGSLINDRYVLTAAHCVARLDAAEFEVYLRRPNIVILNADAIHRRVTRIVLNWYQQVRNNNDVALLLLKDPIRAEDGLVPICLPVDASTFEGRDAIVTGWGTTESGELSEHLQQLTVPILTNQQCRKSGYFRFQITAKMLCAGYLEGGRDSCQGDSGGPLQLTKSESGQQQIVGVVSWGNECAQRNYPGVYARVTRFVSWIRRQSRGACWCTG